MSNIHSLLARHGIWLWVATLLSVYAVVAAQAFSAISQDKQKSQRNHQLRMTPGAVEPGRTPPDPVSANGSFANVTVGIYLDGISNLTIKDSSWTGKFDIWFRWQGSPQLNPGQRFHVVDGDILQKEVVESYSTADGTHYQRYWVRAKIHKFFNTNLFPLDNHMLTILIEDSARGVDELRFIASADSNMSSRVKVHSYKITGWNHVVKNHTYRSTYGHPRATNGKRATFSEYVFAVNIEKHGFADYWMLFRGLFAGVILALASFWIAATDTSPRFGLPSAAYFGAVANGYVIGSTMPPIDEFGLTSFISGLTILSIAMCVVTSLISVYVHREKKAVHSAKKLDKLSFATIALAYSIANLSLVIAATG